MIDLKSFCISKTLPLHLTHVRNLEKYEGLDLASEWVNADGATFLSHWVDCEKYGLHSRYLFIPDPSKDAIEWYLKNKTHENYCAMLTSTKWRVGYIVEADGTTWLTYLCNLPEDYLPVGVKFE